MMKVMLVSSDSRKNGEEYAYSVVAMWRHENDILLIQLNRDVDVRVLNLESKFRNKKFLHQSCLKEFAASTNKHKNTSEPLE